MGLEATPRRIARRWALAAVDLASDRGLKSRSGMLSGRVPSKSGSDICTGMLEGRRKRFRASHEGRRAVPERLRQVWKSLRELRKLLRTLLKSLREVWKSLREVPDSLRPCRNASGNFQNVSGSFKSHGKSSCKCKK
jgi:hypothetical protein